MKANPSEVGSIVLRRLELRDAHSMAELERDKVVQTFLGCGSSTSTPESSLRTQIDHFDRVGWGLFAVIAKDTSTFLGFVGFIPCTAVDSSAPELVCAILREFRGSRVGTRACEEAMAWGFSTHQWPLIYACVAKTNANAHKLAGQLGMKAMRERDDKFDGIQTIFAAQSRDAT